MSNLPIQAHYDGQIYDVIPTSIRPLDLKELLSTFQKSEETTYLLQVHARNPIVNNKLEEGLRPINITLTFQEDIKPYVLVPGGWLPMPLAFPTKFLVDRNVIAQLERIRCGTDRPDELAMKWWNQFFASGDATFDPLFYGLEGTKRRAPTFNEFTDEIGKGVLELKASFPQCKIIDRDVNVLKSFYEFLLQFEDKVRAESAFLIAANPILASCSKKGKEEPKLKALIKLAQEHKIEPFSLVFIAAISCLYENNNGGKFSIGRKLLKFNPTIYSSEMAFNALSDIRHIEMTAQVQTMLQSDSIFSLATCDQGLAAFWCALSPIEKLDDNSKPCFKYSLHEELTPRLSTAEFKELFGQIHTRF